MAAVEASIPPVNNGPEDVIDDADEETKVYAYCTSSLSGP